MFIKEYDCDCARTLPAEYLENTKDSWTIKGEIHYDYYEWINEFVAYNSKTNEIVAGNFEEEVMASSEEALESFLKVFPYKEWNYSDI